MTTKIVALVDAHGNLVRFLLLPGQAHDMRGVAQLVKGVSFNALRADKASMRTGSCKTSTSAVIPPKANHKIQRNYDAALSKSQNMVENYFAKIK